MKTLLRTLLFELSYRFRIFDRTLFNNYPFMHEPHQLKYLMDCLDRIRGVNGICLEIGCAYGASTIFLNKYLAESNCAREYVAIDTFSGFVASDVTHEIENRNKTEKIASIFNANQRKWVERSLEIAGIQGVKLEQHDCAKFDYTMLGTIAFCLIDVDLYKPVLAALDRVYPLLEDGGIIVVDDCQQHEMWDGALEAYSEFVEKHGLPHQIEAGKYGVIHKTS